MIPMTASWMDFETGIPRESGDDPLDRHRVTMQQEYSPRERG